MSEGEVDETVEGLAQAYSKKWNLPIEDRRARTR
jgi:hypothetical protein